MAAFNLNQQQTPSQSCTEISVRAHSTETERERTVWNIRALNRPALGSDLYVFKVKITQETMSSTVCTHHSQTSEDLRTNRVQRSHLATFFQGFLQIFFLYINILKCPFYLLIFDSVGQG